MVWEISMWQTKQTVIIFYVFKSNILVDHLLDIIKYVIGLNFDLKVWIFQFEMDYKW